MAIAELYFKYTDEGVNIKHVPRGGATSVVTTQAFKSLTLLPWGQRVVVEVDSTSKCTGIQTYMGKYQGEHIKMNCTHVTFPRSLDTAVETVAWCMACASLQTSWTHTISQVPTITHQS